MNKRGSLLDELRVRYEALPESTDDHGDVESFQAIDARLREAFRWLEKAITYLNGLKPPIEHRFDLGYGYVFDSPRFAHGSVGQHERRIVGFPVLEGIDVYYEISAVQASVDRGGPRVGLVCREDPRCVRAAIHLPPRGRFRRDAAQVHLFGPARDPGAGLVSCRLSRPGS